VYDIIVIIIKKNCILKVITLLSVGK